MQGFLLGLANGTTCLVFCAPVLIPFLLGEGRGVVQNLATLCKFLAGRLAGYLLLAVLAWAMGGLLLSLPRYETLVVGGAYVGLSLLLFAAALRTVLRTEAPTSGGCAFEGAGTRLRRWPALLPVAMGLLAGFKICPPLLLAFADAASGATLGGSLLLFAAFFVGTSIYFLPISLLGAFSRLPDLRLVGQFAAVVVALYYFGSGLLLLTGGMNP